MDTGSVRHWPRMPEPQLASVLAKGQLNSQLASDTTQRSRMPGMLARLFGGRGQAEDTAAATGNTVATPRKQAEKPPVLAAAAESRSEKVALPVPPAKPAKPIEQAAFAAKPAQKGQLARSDSEPVPISARYEFASMTSKSVGALQPASLIARASISAPSTSANEIINERGYWQGLPGAEAADTAQAGAARPAPAPAARRAIASAAAAPWPLADRSERDAIPNALAYAAQPIPIADAGALSMGSATARAAPAASETTIAVKRSDDARTIASPRAKAVSMVRVGDQFNDPWMRAMIVSPSAQNFMKTTMYGMPDFRALGPYLQKPPSTMMATFSEDPHRGMMTETFSGSAVGFTRTVTFAPPRTASLR